jgi:hypothetical protein
LFWASPDATMTTREMRKWSSGRWMWDTSTGPATSCITFEFPSRWRRDGTESEIYSLAKYLWYCRQGESAKQSHKNRWRREDAGSKISWTLAKCLCIVNLPLPGCGNIGI